MHHPDYHHRECAKRYDVARRAKTYLDHDTMIRSR